jgi:hypothetical protein
MGRFCVQIILIFWVLCHVALPNGHLRGDIWCTIYSDYINGHFYYRGNS